MAVVKQEPSEDRVASPVSALLVTLGETPAPDTLVAALVRDAIDVEVIALGDVSVALPPSRPLVVVWFGATGHPGEARLIELVAWRGRASIPVRIVGCAPEGGVGDSERALAAGFDDFMSGRISPRELSARLRALKRRLRPSPAKASERLRFGRMTLDASRHELWIDARRVALTALEMAIVAELIAAQGRALTRVELLDRVWGEDELDVGVRAVDNLVCRLRRKLGDPELLVTVRGVGFRLSDQ
jgi:DNA-binding response OmpR family regulator